MSNRSRNVRRPRVCRLKFRLRQHGAMAPKRKSGRYAPGARAGKKRATGWSASVAEQRAKDHTAVARPRADAQFSNQGRTLTNY